MPSRPPPTLVLAVLVVLTSSIAGVAVAAPTIATDPLTGTPNSTATCALGTTQSGSTSQTLSVSTWTAPGAAWPDLDSASNVRQAFESNTLTPVSAGANFYDDPAVATGDVVVHRIELNGSATGLLDRLAAQGQGSPEANFGHLVQHSDETGVELYYRGPTACPPTLALDESIANESLRVIPDHDTGALYLVLDVEHLLFYPPGAGEPTSDEWNWGHHAIRFTVRQSTGLVTENTTVGDTYDVADRRVEIDAEHDSLLRLDPAANQTISGKATMAPGTSLTLELVPLGQPNATAVHTATATLDRNGTFTTAFDLTDVPSGTLYTIRVPVTPPDEPPRRLVAVGNATGATLSVADQESIGTVLYASGVTTTHGGFIVARNDTTTVAVSDYFGPGAGSPQPHYDPLLWTNQTLTITVYQDTNDDRQFDPATDEPYRVAGEPVRDTVNVTVDPSGRETTTQSPTEVTASTTTETGPTASSTQQRTTTPSRTSIPTPGLGLGIAVAAFLVAVGILTRPR